MPEEILIDCPNCGVRVSTKPRGLVCDNEEFADAHYFLSQCPSCKRPLFGRAERIADEYNSWCWDRADRLWPNPRRAELGESVPERAKKDLDEAYKCITHGLYSSAVVLCGRALERVIREKTNEEKIAPGLKKLRELGVINSKLYDWAEILRNERNIGAHADDEDTSKEDAEDVLDFTVAIFEYVYTLHDKYQKFMARKRKLGAASNVAPNTGQPVPPSELGGKNE